jgi:hypothetical protein
MGAEPRLEGANVSISIRMIAETQVFDLHLEFRDGIPVRPTPNQHDASVSGPSALITAWIAGELPFTHIASSVQLSGDILAIAVVAPIFERVGPRLRASPEPSLVSGGRRDMDLDKS